MELKTGGRGRLAPGGKIANRFRKTINTEIRLREAVKNFLSDFFPLRGGGYPPFPLRVFGQDDFQLRGEEGTPQFR